MKYFVLPLLFLAVTLYAQERDSSILSSSMAPTMFLIDAENPMKKVKIDPQGTLVFVKYDRSIQNTVEGEVEFERMERFTATVDSLGKEQIHISASEESYTTYENYVMSSKRTGQYFENPKLMSLNLGDIDGVYYSSRRRDVSRNIMFSVLGVSVFTSLVLAPLLSLEYKKVASNDASGFDRPMYFAIAGTGLLGAAISLPLIYLLRPKYYSFQGDNFTRVKKPWILSAE
jgi:hypothetical protein